MTPKKGEPNCSRWYDTLASLLLPSKATNYAKAYGDKDTRGKGEKEINIGTRMKKKKKRENNCTGNTSARMKGKKWEKKLGARKVLWVLLKVFLIIFSVKSFKLWEKCKSNCCFYIDKACFSMIWT